MLRKTGGLKLAGRLVVNRWPVTTDQHVAWARGCHRSWSVVRQNRSAVVAGHRPWSVTCSGLLENDLPSLFLLAFSSGLVQLFFAASHFSFSLHLVARAVFLIWSLQSCLLKRSITTLQGGRREVSQQAAGNVEPCRRAALHARLFVVEVLRFGGKENHFAEVGVIICLPTR